MFVSLTAFHIEMGIYMSVVSRDHVQIIVPCLFHDKCISRGNIIGIASTSCLYNDFPRLPRVIIMKSILESWRAYDERASNRNFVPKIFNRTNPVAVRQDKEDAMRRAEEYLAKVAREAL